VSIIIARETSSFDTVNGVINNFEIPTDVQNAFKTILSKLYNFVSGNRKLVLKNNQCKSNSRGVINSDIIHQMF
jgi:hypothetical protein